MFSIAIIWTARIAALSPRPIPTQETGIPVGIWAIDRRASIPSRAELTGTPITGLIVLEATTPGRWAESPAIAINTLTLFLWAFSIISASLAGVL